MNEPAAAAAAPLAIPIPSYMRLVTVRPPEPQTEVPMMLSDFMHQAWKPGYWSYENGQYIWIQGEIIAKPDFTAIWLPDHWERREFGWTFVAGYWQ